MSAPEKSSPADTVLRPGLVGRATARVTGRSHRARPRQRIDRAVYATPAMVALMEQAAVACTDHLLKPGEATVGVAAGSSNTPPPPRPASTSTAEATLTAVDGRKLSFSIVARDTAGPIGEAAHTGSSSMWPVSRPNSRGSGQPADTVSNLTDYTG